MTLLFSRGGLSFLRSLEGAPSKVWAHVRFVLLIHRKGRLLACSELLRRLKVEFASRWLLLLRMATVGAKRPPGRRQVHVLRARRSAVRLSFRCVILRPAGCTGHHVLVRRANTLRYPSANTVGQVLSGPVARGDVLGGI